MRRCRATKQHVSNAAVQLRGLMKVPTLLRYNVVGLTHGLPRDSLTLFSDFCGATRRALTVSVESNNQRRWQCGASSEVARALRRATSVTCYFAAGFDFAIASDVRAD